MQIVVAGVNYKSAPLAMRERLAITPSEHAAFYKALRARTPEGFLLETCNRTEVFALAGHAETGGAALLSLLAEFRGFQVHEIEQYVYRRGYEGAIRHAFAVAAGVDSMVPGEEQIMAQLRLALQHADEHDALGPVMHRLGAAALATGKRVRAETGISRHSLSVVSVALRAATQELGELGGRAVLIVGAGQTAQLTLKHLKGAGATVRVCNRTDAAATELATAHGATAVPWAGLVSAIAGADLVLSCTNAPESVIGVAVVEEALRRRHGNRLLIIDLAIPRDVDPEVSGLSDVRLMDLGHLEALCSDNRRSRTAEFGRAEEIITSSVEKFMTWWNARQVAPTIAALLSVATEMRDREVERTLARLTHLTERDREIVRALGARLVTQLFHHPLRTLKTSEEGANLAWAIQELFGLPDNPALHGPSRASHAHDRRSADASKETPIDTRKAVTPG